MHVRRSVAPQRTGSPLRFLSLLCASALLLACDSLDPLGPPEEPAPRTEDEAFGYAPRGTLGQLSAASSSTGPSATILQPRLNETIDIDHAGPAAVTFIFKFQPHPDDETGGVAYVLNENEPVPIPAPSPGMEAWLTLDIPKGAHFFALLVTDDDGLPRSEVTARATVSFKVSIPCVRQSDCEDGNPCSASYCLVVGDTQRCRYGAAPLLPHCCRTEFECAPHEMCTDIFPLNRPDGIKECVGCDGTPGNCPPRPCMVASCHPFTFTCVYEPRDDDCCIPGLDICPLHPCIACLPEGGFEGVCGPVGPPGECCLTTDAPPGEPDFGCFTDEPCTIFACIDNLCRYDVRYTGCCTQDTDCRDPFRLNPCTGEYGVCQNLVVPEHGGPPTGTCAYPRVVPGCCVTSTDCLGRFPVEIGTCVIPEGELAGECVYSPNENYCETPGPGVVINEIMMQSNVGNPGNWIELFNTTENDVDLRGFQVIDLENPARSFTLENETPLIIPATGFFVIGVSREPLLQGEANFDFSVPEMELLPAGDGMRLQDPDDVVSDIVEWDATFPIVPGHSIARTSPYRPSDGPAAWRTAGNRYGIGGRGTPGGTNIDAYDATWVPHMCDDGDPCTLDLCHINRTNLCANVRIPGCCALEDDPACDDKDRCTVDSCDVENFRCVHEFDVGTCCRNDGECPPAPPHMEFAEAAAFSVCTVPRCVSRRCAYVRRPERPGCCISADHPQVGCRDYNPCTVGVCDPLAGTNEFGMPYPACTFLKDLTGDGLNDCCYEDADCEDGDPTTAHRCLTEASGVAAFTCERGPNPDYCGPRAPSRDCDDGDHCTDDYCCQDVDDPVVGCPGTFRCLHVRRPDCCANDEACDDGDRCTISRCCTAPGVPLVECEWAGQCLSVDDPTCCYTDAQCEERKPVALACLTARCFNFRCIYGEPIVYEGCCVDGADCTHPDRCRVFACEAGMCVEKAPLVPPQCCYEDRQCPRTNDPCRPWVCRQQACVQLTIPGCCRPEEEGFTGPCNDGNPCTDGICRGGRCLYTAVSGPLCCMEDENCPPTGARCARARCVSEDARCEMEVLPLNDPACASTLPFHESFSMNDIWQAETTFAMLGWQVMRLPDTGGGPTAVPAGERLFALVNDDPLLGGRTAQFAYTGDGREEHCIVSPPIDTRGIATGTLQWREGTQSSGAFTRRVFVGPNTGWWQTLNLRPTSTVLLGSRQSVPLSGSHLGNSRTRVAFCARRNTTAAPPAAPLWSIDDIVLAAGEPPRFTAVPDDIIVAFARNTRWLPIELTDDGVAPRGFGRIPGITLQLVDAPPFMHLLHDLFRNDGRQQVWIGLYPRTRDEGLFEEIVLKASDGALVSYETIAVEVRSALCGADSDCDDGDPCTIGICLDDASCFVYQPPGCYPVTMSQ